MGKPSEIGVIHAGTAYSKRELMTRLQISQKFWDQMLDAGLPFTEIGHSRWVLGEAVLEYIRQNAKTKKPATAR